MKDKEKKKKRVGDRGVPGCHFIIPEHCRHCTVKKKKKKLKKTRGGFLKYKFEKIIGNPNFSDLFKRTVNHFKNNLDSMRQTAC